MVGRATAANSLLIAALVVAVVLLLGATRARADEWVWTKCDHPNWPSSAGSGIFDHGSVFGINTAITCGHGASASHLDIAAGPNHVAAGQRAYFQATAPVGLTIEHFWVPQDPITYTRYIDDGHEWGGGFYWTRGGAQTGDNSLAGGYSSPNNLNSSFIGWQVVCGASPCNGAAVPSEISIGQIGLDVAETTVPAVVALGPNNLWYQSGHYVRGAFPISFQASDPAGVCGVQAVVDGESIQGPQASPNGAAWHQCPDQTWYQAVNTARYADGPLSLMLAARSAAGASSSPTQALRVDNQPVQASLSGPQDAPANADTQYVNASATAGLSGVQGISCSVDNAPAQWHPGASAAVPVQGVGVHHLSCWAANNSYDANGRPAWSAPASWSLSIREPTVIGAAFAHVADALRCARHSERIRIAAHWVKIRRHGKLVRVKRSAHTRTVRVVRCHPRLVERRVQIHGHWRTERVPVLPHLVNQTSKRIPFGARATISGWLGTAGGTALGGQRVRILTAPDNGLNHFRQAAVVTTASNGSWTAELPSGPSRLIQAVYDGSAITEPAASADARVVVPAIVRIRIHPRAVRWGGTIHITGRVLGDYIPSGKLLRLRIGAEGVQGTVGIPDIQRNGRFRTTWTFSSGQGVVHYWFSVSTLPEGDYPYAPSSSSRVGVTVRPG